MTISFHFHKSCSGLWAKPCKRCFSGRFLFWEERGGSYLSTGRAWWVPCTAGAPWFIQEGGTWTGNSFSAGCSATLHTNYPLWADIHLGKHCVFCVIQPVDRDIYNQEHAQKYLWYSFGPHWADIRALIFFMNIYFFNHVYLSYKSTFNNFITFYLPPDPYLKTFCKYPNQFRLFQKTKGESEFKNIFLKTEPICGSVLTELLKFIRIIFGENCLFWCLRVLFHWNLLASKWLLSNYLRLTK